MCIGARSGSNPGPLGSKASALTNCASCPLAAVPDVYWQGKAYCVARPASWWSIMVSTGRIRLGRPELIHYASGDSSLSPQKRATSATGPWDQSCPRIAGAELLQPDISESSESH